MSAQEKQNDLNAFEAALAALMPRTDRLDRDRLMFLAGQQSILAGHELGATAGLSSSVGGTAGQAGHQPKVAHGSQAWPWPAAFAAMSALAATLFVILISRPGPVAIENIAKQTASQSALATDSKETADYSDFNGRSRRNRTDTNLALLFSTDNRKFNEADSPNSYSAILEQILTQGIDSWKPKATGSHGAKSIFSRPLTNSELISQLINEGA